MSPKEDFYVYVHRKQSDDQVFYVGKGRLYRATETWGRNKFWKNVANKHGWKVDIIDHGLNEKEAFELEISTISFYKSMGVRLCNLTFGGDGPSGYRHSPESRAKMSAGMMGRKSWLEGKSLPEYMKQNLREKMTGRKQSSEHAAKSRIVKIGKKQPQSAIDHLIARKSVPIINSNGEIFKSASEASRQMSIRLGQNCSQGNISECARGFRNQVYGLSWSYKTNEVPRLLPMKKWAMITCVENDIVFKSVCSAVEWIISWRGSAHNQCVSQAARNGTIAYGFHWKYDKPPKRRKNGA